MSAFANVPLQPPDAILNLATQFKEDTFAKKVNLGIGAYRCNEGKPWPLPSVLKAQEMVCNDPKEDKEYVPIDGKPEHKPLVQALVFSQDTIAAKRLATTQAISGTGALSIIGNFLSEYVGTKKIYMPQPTWGNHGAIFKRCSLEPVNYTYYKPETRGFDFEGCIAAIKGMDEGQAILLHACAQNPTGVDPSPEQWEAIAAACQERKLVPVLDNAYQGYATGDLEKDNYSVAMFERLGMEFFVSQSFAKNFGLYGERIGYIHGMTGNAEQAAAVLSCLKLIIRGNYSSPPRHGAAIVHKILTTPELEQQWKDELAFMANRIVDMRKALRDALEAKGTPGTWNHITDQIGMFSFTGLTTPQCERLVSEFHIYLLKNGRISMAGINTNCVQYVADSFDTVVRES